MISLEKAINGIIAVTLANGFSQLLCLTDTKRCIR